MRISILDYAKQIAPLHELLEIPYNKVGKRTKKAVPNITISNFWGAKQYSAFNDTKQQLVSSVN